MGYSQNELEILLDALGCALEETMKAQADANKQGIGIWGHNSTWTIKYLQAYGETIRRLRLEEPLTDADWEAIHHTLESFCEECMFLPQEISLAYVLMRHLEAIGRLRGQDSLG